jgi:hypothetical protein
MKILIITPEARLSTDDSLRLSNEDVVVIVARDPSRALLIDVSHGCIECDRSIMNVEEALEEVLMERQNKFETERQAREDSKESKNGIPPK